MTVPGSPLAVGEPITSPGPGCSYQISSVLSRTALYGASAPAGLINQRAVTPRDRGTTVCHTLKGRPLTQRHPRRWLAAGLVLFVSGLALLTIAGNLGVGRAGEPVTALPVPVVPPAETAGPTRTPAPAPGLATRRPGSTSAPGPTPAPGIPNGRTNTTDTVTNSGSQFDATGADNLTGLTGNPGSGDDNDTAAGDNDTAAGGGSGAGAASGTRTMKEVESQQPRTPTSEPAPIHIAQAPGDSLSAIITAVTGMISAVAGLIVVLTGVLALQRRSDTGPSRSG